MSYLTRPRERFDKGGMAKLVEYAKNLPKNTILTRNMVEDYVKKNKLNVNIENFFNRKAPNIKGLKVDTSFQFTDIEKNRIEKFGKSKYDKLGPEQRYQVRKGVDVGALAPEKQQKVKFKKAYSDAEKFYKSAGIKIDDSIKEIIRKNIANNKGKFVPPGKGAKAFRGNVMKVLRDVFVNNPDANSIDIAKAIYGDKKFNAASLIKKEKMIQDARSQVPKFIRLFSPGSKEIIKGFKDIKPEVLADILESVESRIGDFGFDSGTRRELQFAIADAEKGLPERATVEARKKILTKGKAVDETIGVSSTFKNASGYIEATQVIDPKINTLKGKTIDRDFKSAFEKAMKGDYSEVKNYNKKAIAFQNKYNVDTPIIRTGENLDPKKFVSEFENYSPGAQKNINQIAKDKGIVIQTKSKPLFSFPELGGDTAKYLAAIGCPGKAMGGRIGFQEGTVPTQACIIKGANVVNQGNVKNLSQAQRVNLERFLKLGYRGLRTVMKFGIIPEAIFATGESLLRVGMGDTLPEAFLRSIDYLVKGDQTAKAQASKIARTIGKDEANLFKDVSAFRAAQKNLESAKSNLETNQAVLDGSGFGYTANIDGISQQEIDEQRIKKAKKELFLKKVSPDTITIDDYFSDLADDKEKAKSFFTRALAKQKEFAQTLAPVKDESGLNFDLNSYKGFNTKPVEVFPNFRDTALRNPDQIIDDINLSYRAGEFGPVGLESSRDAAAKDAFEDIKAYDFTKTASLNELADKYGIEQIFGANPENQLQKILPPGASFSPQLQGSFAGGGIAGLSGGIDKGPQVKSMNPDSGGLAFFQNNVKKL